MSDNKVGPVMPACEKCGYDWPDQASADACCDPRVLARECEDPRRHPVKRSER